MGDGNFSGFTAVTVATGNKATKGRPGNWKTEQAPKKRQIFSALIEPTEGERQPQVQIERP